jgi:hypothetical protein
MCMCEIKDKITNEYTGIMRMCEFKKRLTTNIQVLCTCVSSRKDLPRIYRYYAHAPNQEKIDHEYTGVK